MRLLEKNVLALMARMALQYTTRPNYLFCLPHTAQGDPNVFRRIFGQRKQGEGEGGGDGRFALAEKLWR